MNTIVHAATFVVIALAGLPGCTRAASPSLAECESLCGRQGKTVSGYHVGTAVPIFKRSPSVRCSCGAGQAFETETR